MFASFRDAATKHLTEDGGGAENAARGAEGEARRVALQIGDVPRWNLVERDRVDEQEGVDALGRLAASRSATARRGPRRRSWLSEAGAP
jgi:hypothetical protein